jgi:hypothetical protein
MEGRQNHLISNTVWSAVVGEPVAISTRTRQVSKLLIRRLFASPVGSGHRANELVPNRMGHVRRRLLDLYKKLKVCFYRRGIVVAFLRSQEKNGFHHHANQGKKVERCSRWRYARDRGWDVNIFSDSKPDDETKHPRDPTIPDMNCNVAKLQITVMSASHGYVGGKSLPLTFPSRETLFEIMAPIL